MAKYTKADMKYFGIGSAFVLATAIAAYKAATTVNRIFINGLAEHCYPDTTKE